MYDALHNRELESQVARPLDEQHDTTGKFSMSESRNRLSRTSVQLFSLAPGVRKEVDQPMTPKGSPRASDNGAPERSRTSRTASTAAPLARSYQRKTRWRAHRDSNPEPSASKADAVPETHQRVKPSTGSIRDQIRALHDLAIALTSEVAQAPRVRDALVSALAESVLAAEFVQLAAATLSERDADRRLSMALQLASQLLAPQVATARTRPGAVDNEPNG